VDIAKEKIKTLRAMKPDLHISVIRISVESLRACTHTARECAFCACVQ